MATSVDEASATPTPSREERLAAWERKTRPLIIATALIPLVGATTGTDQYGLLGDTIEISCWIVFVIDFVVHLRLQENYLRTGFGRFDLVVVILTSPWYLLPGVDGGEFITLLRLARIARVAMVGFKTPVVKRMLGRLGRPFLYMTIVLLIAAAIEMRAEDQHHGFATYGDSVWWGIVTITTVGYGDVVPQTTLGRVVATVLMFTGVALLGTVAASLAAMFRVEDQAVEDSSRTGVGAVTGGGEAAGGPGRDGVPADPTTMSDVSTELRALRAEVAALREELGRRT